MFLKPTHSLLLILMLLSGCSKTSAPKSPGKQALTKETRTAVSEPDSTIEKTGPESVMDMDDCADCHPDHVDGFQETGMGRSFYRPQSQPRIEDFKKATVKHPISGIVYRAYVDEQGRWWQEESLDGTDYKRRVEVEYIIGSGNHTRSYLGTVENELIQMPLTWYSGRKLWDMSPGYHGPNHFRFNRPIKAPCLFCHNDLTPARDGTQSGYTEKLAEGISCIRCHGDATAHVKARIKGLTPPKGKSDILNPRTLSNSQQLKLCQQCHLAGETRVLLPGKRWDQYEPTEPLENHMAIYSYATDGGAEFGIASHGQRLSLSACFKKSDGQLTCTKCHDPHKKKNDLGARTACLSCHAQKDCGQAHRHEANGDCAGCHMHRGGTSDIPHVTFTDHFIRKKPGDEPAKPAEQGTVLIDALAVHRENSNLADAAVRLGIAHALVWRNNNKPAHRPVALQHLSMALKAQPEHVDGLIELGSVHAARGDLPSARAVFAKAESLAPKRVLFLIDYAQVLEKLGDLKGAQRILEKASQLRPDYRVAWTNLANIHQRMGAMKAASMAYDKANAIAPHVAMIASNRGYLAIQEKDLETAEKWFLESLKRDPTDGRGRMHLANLALRRGQKQAAKKQLALALERNPKLPLAHWISGLLASEAKDFTKARQHFNAMIKLAPNDPRGYIDLARVEMSAGQIQAAVKVLLEGRRLNPNSDALIRAFQRFSSGQAL